MFAGVARILVPAHVVPRPAVVAAGLYMRDVVGDKIVAEGVTLVDRAPRLAWFRADGQADAVAYAVGENPHTGTVGIEFENIGAIFFARRSVGIIDIGGRSDRDEHFLAIGGE